MILAPTVRQDTAVFARICNRRDRLAFDVKKDLGYTNLRDRRFRPVQQGRVATNMIVDRAELEIEQLNSSEMMADVQLVGSANAAVDLDGCLRHETTEAPYMGLGCRYGALSSRRFTLQAKRRTVCDRDRLFARDEHIDHTVLERLKFSDRLPELTPGLRISNRGCQERIDRSGGVRTQSHDCLVYALLDLPSNAAAPADAACLWNK
jgi:hypothetical protein